MKDLQEIKDEYAFEAGFADWHVLVCYGEDMDTHVEEIAIRYAKEVNKDILDEINESIKDLLCMQSSINEAMKTDSRWEGMYDLLQKQIDRNKELIKSETQI